jgi:hypothetical protein
MASGQPSRRSPAEHTATAVAELSAIADGVERNRDRVAAIAVPFLGTEREDAVSVLHEAERQLMIAARSLRRAIRTLGG